MELKLIQLTIQYGSKTAIDHVNLTLCQGVYGLLGPNGAGKTTLMRLLCDLQTPSSGKIILDRQEIAGLGESYRNLLGYLPQHFGYYPDSTAWDFLMYVAALKGIGEPQAKQKSSELLEAVGLSAKAQQKIKTFSGGMKQRLGIAQALLNNPQILILDEPTAGLDPKERVRFRNLISSLAKDRIILLSTHIVSDIESIADKIIILKDGQLLNYGQPQVIIQAIEGYVWDCVLPNSQIEQYADSFPISHQRNIGQDQTVLRVISQHRPLDKAVSVPATLEDAYLFYFEGVVD